MKKEKCNVLSFGKVRLSGSKILGAIAAASLALSLCACSGIGGDGSGVGDGVGTLDGIGTIDGVGTLDGTGTIDGTGTTDGAGTMALERETEPERQTEPQRQNLQAGKENPGLRERRLQRRYRLAAFSYLPILPQTLPAARRRAITICRWRR